MKSWWTLVLLACFAFSSKAQEINYREIALPTAVRTSTLDLLHTDKKGFLWLAVGPGLYWYDGLQFHKVDTDTTGRPGDGISTLFDDHQGRVWVGWRSGFISTVQGDSTHAYQPEEGTPSAPIVRWAEDDRDQLWMATDGEGLYVRATNGRWYNFDEDDGLPSEDSYDLAAMANTVMLATDQGLVRCSFDEEKKHLEVIAPKDGLADQIVKSLYADSLGLLAAFYEPFLNTISRRGVISAAIPAPGPDAHIIWRSGEVLWWLSEGGNLYQKTGSSAWQLIELDKARHAQIRHLAADKEGHMWVSTNKGLFLIDQWYSHRPTPKPVTALCVSGTKIWYSQEGTLYEMDRLTDNTQKAWEGENLILNLYADHWGRIWAGTFDGGTIMWDPSTFSKYQFTEAEGLSNNNVLSIDGNKEGIWLGTLGGVTRIVFATQGNIDAIKTYDRHQGMDVQYIYAVHVAEDGQVFLGTDGEGILRWDGKSFRPLSIDLPREVVLDLATGPEGVLWWVTPDGVLHGWSAARGLIKVPSYPEEPGKVAGLLAADDGSVYIIHEGGIHRWHPARKAWRAYQKSFGFAAFQPELHAHCLHHNNSLYLGTARGITTLQLDLLPAQAWPHTRLTGVELFLQPTSSHVFSSGENHITFKYIGRWYTNPTAVRYRIKLQGYDLDWIESQNPEITYPRLPPGDYKFSVVAGIDGHYPKDQVKQFEFTIKSAWYTRWYSILIFILLLAGLALLLFRFRVKSLQQKQEREKQQVRAQYEALKSQVNPHFLFNSFNTLMALIEDDKAEATGYLAALSDFFRHILEFREIDLITVEEEMDIVQTYLSLQAKRFGSNLRVEIDLGEVVLETRIPPLTLQLLVENAFKHNVISRSKPLDLRIFEKDGYLVVWNKLQLKARPDASTGYGLDSIEKKYKFYSNQPIKTEKSSDHFAVYLPLI